MKRRDFLKTVASSGLVIAASDLVGELIAQSPQGKPLESQFKGLADVALAEVKRTRRQGRRRRRRRLRRRR